MTKKIHHSVIFTSFGNNNMISVSFTLHPNRAANLDLIFKAYESYDIVDEVLIVTGTEVTLDKSSSKFKFVHMPGPYTYGSWPSFGLLSRYTWALNCKNRYVFMQDDDFVYKESTMEKMLNMQQPITGCHYRWFYNNEYKFKPEFKNQTTAPLILTGGTLVDSWLLPDVIKYAKVFWDDYQNVFNGEDMFMSRAISKITGQNEFPFVTDDYTNLPTHDVKLNKVVNKKRSRTILCNKIYNFFETVKL